MNLREVKGLSQGHTASKWWLWLFNPGLEERKSYAVIWPLSYIASQSVWFYRAPNSSIWSFTIVVETIVKMEMIKADMQPWIICVLCRDVNAGLRGVRHGPASQGGPQLTSQWQADA